ncbi:MAG: 1-(5-phosphoribosyl)-5-[(5-phosphoribosylamino)methylideneamino]imidazole-4-carboxamide isomerase [Candidatus Puniceispirillaceae bacterium]
MSQFQIYPAIDLKEGQGVRLLHGDFNKMTVYAPNPAKQAQEFLDLGAKWVHVVDLDGALAGAGVNNEAVRAILATGAKIQLGGGIRSMAHIETWLEAGVARVILGTAALREPQLVIEAARAFPDQVAVGADAKGGMIAAEGWLDVSDVKATDLVRRFEDCGVAAVIFTDIGRDGALTGVNAQATAEIAQAVSIPVIASGGVADKQDIAACLSYRDSGIAGVITGRAIYDGRLDLQEAIAMVQEG